MLKSILTRDLSSKLQIVVSTRLNTTPSATKICEKLLEKSVKISTRNDLLDGKIAIIVGGTGSIGLACAKEMLKNSLQAVTIADLNPCKGELAIEELCNEFGKGRANFVKCDATNSILFDWTFKSTLKKYKRVDILVNCVGFFDEKNWEEEIRVNMNAYVIGSLLGLQYMSKACKGNGGTIVNVASIMGLEPYSGCPIYTMTQHGIIGLTKSLGCGEYYEHTLVKFMSLCPGFTKSEFFEFASQKCINNKFGKEFQKEMETQYLQDPCFVGRALITMLHHGKPASIWIIEDENDAIEIKIPNYR